MEYKAEKKDSDRYTYRVLEEFTAGDVVDALEAQEIHTHVSWEDDGDCGMKSGGSCYGVEFIYPAMSMPWGGCFYVIRFIYKGREVIVYTSDSSSNVPSQDISCYGLSEVDELPKLLGWI